MAGEDETAKHQQFLRKHIWGNFSQSKFQDTKLVGFDGTLQINRIYLTFLFPDLDSSVLGVSVAQILIIAPDVSTQEIKERMKSVSTNLESFSQSNIQDHEKEVILTLLPLFLFKFSIYES